jgi:hypothetical protein
MRAVSQRKGETARDTDAARATSRKYADASSGTGTRTVREAVVVSKGDPVCFVFSRTPIFMDMVSESARWAPPSLAPSLCVCRFAPQCKATGCLLLPLPRML